MGHFLSEKQKHGTNCFHVPYTVGQLLPKGKENIMHCLPLTLTHIVGYILEESIIQEHAEVVKDKGGAWFIPIT